MVFFSEDGEVKSVGYPTEVETFLAGKGKGKVTVLGVSAEGEGAKYEKVKYDWVHLTKKPLSETEQKELDKKIEAVSNTIVMNSSVIAQTKEIFAKSDAIIASSTIIKCIKCGTRNQETALFCSNCGNSLRT